MNKEILCGSACAKYILEKYNKKPNISKKMIWISQLALCLYENDLKNLKLLCYKSNLYDDFINKNVDQTFEGFKYLKNISDKIIVEEKIMNDIELKKEIKENKFIILCVESRKLNKDNSMHGGHFIILNGISNNIVNVINPIKNKYEYINKSIEELIYYCRDFGSWRLLIKGDNL